MKICCVKYVNHNACPYLTGVNCTIKTESEAKVTLLPDLPFPHGHVHYTHPRRFTYFMLHSYLSQFLTLCNTVCMYLYTSIYYVCMYISVLKDIMGASEHNIHIASLIYDLSNI
jgi:hypothetical protein